jgi:hypothetical protein
MFTPLRLESSPIGSLSARESVTTPHRNVLDPVVAAGCIVRPCRANRKDVTVQRQDELAKISIMMFRDRNAERLFVPQIHRATAPPRSQAPFISNRNGNLLAEVTVGYVRTSKRVAARQAAWPGSAR